ncbi:MAG: FAD-binding oxidoreductase [Pseudomonadota bacterium]
MADQNSQVLVVGAGIVGVSTALYLKREGLDVTILDREGPAAGTSYGNAGILATSEVIPVTTPGLWKYIPKALFSKNEPLFFKWSYLPKLAPFLLRYLTYANEKDMKQTAADLLPLVYDSVEQHRALAAGTDAEQFIRDDEYVYCYPDQAAFEAEKDQWALRSSLGLAHKTADAEELSIFDPVLKGKFGFAARTLNHGSISDPGAYVTALFDAFTELGGKFIKASAQQIVTEGDSAIGVMTDKGLIKSEKIVIACGAWSNTLMGSVGAKVPLESERGYHIEFVNPNIELRCTIMVRQKKFAMNSMNGRLRCAGIVEFAGLEAPASDGPFKLLRSQVKAIFPELTYDSTREWMGHRPSTTDSLPVIGSVGALSNVWAGFGHQHLGLTMGPKTGKWLTHLITGKQLNDNLAPYAADRF